MASLKKAENRKHDHELERPRAPLDEFIEPPEPGVVGDITTPHGRQREMELAIAENVASFYSNGEAPDLTLTPRAMGTLAGLLLAGGWTTIVDLQLVLEDNEVIIPMASLYPLLDRLVAIGFVARKAEQGSKGRPSKGRPKSFYQVTHSGRCAVALGQAVSKSLNREGAEAND